MSRARSETQWRSEPLIFRFTRDIPLPGWHWEGNEARKSSVGTARYEPLRDSGRVQPIPALLTGSWQSQATYSNLRKG